MKGHGALALALAVLAGPSSASAQRVVSAGSVRSGTLSFDGRSTLGDFTGTTTTLKGEMTGGPLTDVRGWVEAPVNTLKTSNDRRDRDLLKSMEAERFPTIRFDLDTVRSQWERNDSAGVALVGRFTIHGVTRPATVNALLHLSDGRVSVAGDVPLNLKDFEIGGLSKFLGILKMNPDIIVHLYLMF
ncbi:MAG: YceI family protein [Gemmatimonadota bacterium]